MIARWGLERDREPGRLARNHDELVGETGRGQLLAQPAPKIIVADAADQPSLHAGFDRGQPGIGAGAADPDRHLISEPGAARRGQVSDRAHQHISLHAADDRDRVYPITKVVIHMLMQGSCLIARKRPSLTG